MAGKEICIAMTNENRTSSGSEAENPPPSTPSAKTYKHAIDQDYAISILMEMQRTLGKIENAVEKLTESEVKTKEKLGRIEKVMYAAGVILIIAVAIGGWTLNAAKDFAMTYYKASMEAQRPQPVVPPPTPQNQDKK